MSVLFILISYLIITLIIVGSIIYIIMYEYNEPKQDLVSVYEYFESKGYKVEVTDIEDGTLIFITWNIFPP